MVQWILDHFTGLEIPSEVVTEAAKNGHFSVLKYLWEHDGGRECPHELQQVKLEEEAWTDSVPVKPSDWEGPGHVVRWGGHAIREAARAEHQEIAKWLYDNTPHQSGARERCDILESAVNVGNFDLARLLLPLDSRIIDHVCHWARVQVIKKLLEETDILKKKQEFAGSAIVEAAHSGNLELMQRISKLHERKKKKEEWADDWESGMRFACERGDLPMLKWMVGYSTGQEVLQGIKNGTRYTSLLSAAAGGAHLEVLDYISKLGFSDEDAEALVVSARAGHLNSIIWLIERSPSYSEYHSTDRVVVEAAKNGHLEILKFFQDLNSIGRSAGKKGVKRRKTEPTIEWWTRSSEAMDEAAGNGHLAVVKWFAAIRSERCSVRAMDRAARSNHLDMVKWLHSNMTAGCTNSALDGAAAQGHLEMCK